MPVAAALPAILGTVGSVAGGYLSASGARSAANAQAAAADRASQTQLHIYDQIRNDLSPFLKTGTGAINSLASLFGFGNGGHGPTPQTMQNALATFRNTPGYQFSYDQGLNALDRSAASRGMLLSGGQLKDAQTYGQGVADQGYGNYFNQLFQLSGLGESAGAASGDAGIATGQGVARNQLYAGNATANGITDSNTNLLNGLGGGLQNAIYGYQVQQQADKDAAANQFAQQGAWSVSDVRAKTDIEKIGKTDSGLNVYSFRYRGDNKLNIGVMAQEVEKIQPDAVANINGLKVVNLKKVSEHSKAVRNAFAEMRAA